MRLRDAATVLYAAVALPVYAVAIGAQVVLLAYRMAKLEARLQREAREAVEQHRADIAAEVERHRAASANWKVN